MAVFYVTICITTMMLWLRRTLELMNFYAAFIAFYLLSPERHNILAKLEVYLLDLSKVFFIYCGKYKCYQ
jgi:hypothetical protein